MNPQTQTILTETTVTSPANEHPAVKEAIAAAIETLTTAGDGGFVLIVHNEEGEIRSMLAGQLCSLVESVHVALSSLGSVVKKLQEPEGMSDRTRNASDFVIGASLVASHERRLEQDLNRLQQEANASTKQ